jgi:hypothetical protein
MRRSPGPAPRLRDPAEPVCPLTDALADKRESAAENRVPGVTSDTALDANWRLMEREPEKREIEAAVIAGAMRPGFGQRSGRMEDLAWNEMPFLLRRGHVDRAEIAGSPADKSAFLQQLAFGGLLN